MRVFHHTRWLAVLTILLAFTQWQCTKKPTSPASNREIPGQPFGLTISTGDRQIELSWAIDNPARVRSYRIYRRDTTSATFFYLDSSLVTKYVDRFVRNGVIYYYQVAAVARNGGAEGSRSATVAAVPNTYAIRIAGGADFTNNRQVTIDISAPASTTAMLFGNDTSFSGSAWQPFAASLQWLLSNGDGLKTVHAKFRDANGNETRTRSSDAITLDTFAFISSVSENTGGVAKKEGDVIHFSLNAGEPNGRAAVTVDGIAQPISLYDDGRPGDAAANDGIYEVNYIVPDDAEVTQARVRGSFTDRANNVAPAGVVAPGRITIARAPAAVQLFDPTLAGNNGLRLSWNAATETDFANYSIYRSTTPNFTPAPNSLLFRVTVRQTTNYTDSPLQEGVTYYYRVIVFDAGNLGSAPSNEVSGRIATNLPPRAVDLYAPQAGPDPAHQVVLSWSQSTDSDFATYRILRSTTLPIDTLAAPIISIDQNKTTSYTDNTVKPATQYYYQIVVVDQGGKTSRSNVAAITTSADLPPAAVTLAQPIATDVGELSLSWSRNNDADFSSYRIYRSKTPGITENQPPIKIINDPDETTFDDAGLEAETNYYYKVFVHDQADLSAGSNEVMGTTR